MLRRPRGSATRLANTLGETRCAGASLAEVGSNAPATTGAGPYRVPRLGKGCRTMSIYRRTERFSPIDDRVDQVPRAANDQRPRPGSAPAKPDADWTTNRKNEPANGLLKPTFAWASTLPVEVRPTLAALQVSRIANLMAAMWPDPNSFRRYMDDLLVDKRGNRQGFPRRRAEGIVRAARLLRRAVSRYVAPVGVADPQRLSRSRRTARNVAGAPPEPSSCCGDAVASRAFRRERPSRGAMAGVFRYHRRS